MTATPIGAPQDGEELERMAFGDHLDELRRRLLISIGAVAVAVLVLMPFKQEITAVYIKPYRIMWTRAFEGHLERYDAMVREAGGVESLHPIEQKTVEFLNEWREDILAGTFPATGRIEVMGNFRMPYALKATGGLEDFWTFMAAVLLFSIMIAAPVVLWQMWSFISAGLYERERKVAMKYFPFAAGLLIAGVSFGYFLAVPFGLYFLVTMMNWFQIEPMLTVGKYFTFLLTLTAALGFVFQLPLMMMAVVKVGLVKHRVLKKNWRFIVLGFFAVSAVLTPPDPFTQMLMACPMILLYIVGLMFTARIKPMGPQPLPAAGGAAPPDGDPPASGAGAGS